MTTEPSADLQEQAEIQEDEVQQREGLEEKLMQEGRSEAGAEIPDAGATRAE